MKNNRAFAKFEVLTIIVLLLVIVTILMLTILNSLKNQRINAMISSARQFSNSVIVDNIENSTYYLRDAINDELFDNIRSPFSSGNCDVDESKVDYVNSQKYVTFKCDNYLIYNEEADNKEYKVYKVSEWLNSKNSDDYENRIGYNCKKGKNLLFDSYYDEKSFLYYINKKYNKEYFDISEVSECEIIKKNLFRNLSLIR